MFSENTFIYLSQIAPHLKELRLKNAHNLSDRGLNEMANNLKELETLDITGSVVHTISPQFINLKELILSNTPVSEGTITGLVENAKKLESLYLDGAFVLEDHAVFVLNTLSGLKALSLGRCIDASKNTVFCYNLKKPILLFPKLEMLSLSGIPELDENVAEIFSHHAANLKVLILKLCFKITDRDIEPLLQRSTSLTTLDISGCINLTDTTLFTISNYCTQIKKLYISSCTKIRGHALHSLCSRCVELEKLDIGETPLILSPSHLFFRILFD